MSALSFHPSQLDDKLSEIIHGLSDEEKLNLLKLLNASVSPEKRISKRKHFFIPVNVICRNKSFYSRIENLSEKGAFIKTNHVIPPGNEVDLIFSILNFEFPVNLKAEVIWLSKQGLGIKFKRPSTPSDRLALEKVVDAINPKPVKL